MTGYIGNLLFQLWLSFLLAYCRQTSFFHCVLDRKYKDTTQTTELVMKAKKTSLLDQQVHKSSSVLTGTINTLTITCSVLLSL